MHISQKPKDLLPIVDVPSKTLTILSNIKEKLKLKKSSIVLVQACIYNAYISQDTENITTNTLCWPKTI